MPIKLQIVTGALLALSLTQNIRTRSRAKLNARLFLEDQAEFEAERRANEAQITYLCHMLDKHDIPADEFDLIALYYNQ